MRKGKKLVIAVLSMILAFVLGLGMTGCAEKKDTIAVVAKGESHAFWQAVKSGAEKAGKEFGYDITFHGPKSETSADAPEQQGYVQTALSNNVKALVFAATTTGYVDKLSQAFDKKIPVIQFDSGVWAEDIAALNTAKKNPIKASVATSNELAAALAATNFYAAIKADITAATTTAKYYVGIIQHDTTQTGIDRTKGFKEQFEKCVAGDTTTAGKAEVRVEIKTGDADGAYKAALEALTTGQNIVKAVFMTNEGVVKQVYDAIGSAGTKYDAIKFCGYDAGTKQIEWMRKTTGAKLVGAVAQNSIDIGYQAVKQAVNAIKGNKVEDVSIAGAWWNAGNVDQMIKDNLVYKG